MEEWKYDREEIKVIIDSVIQRTMQMDLTWEWPCGVAYYGISKVYEELGGEQYLKLLKLRIDELIALGLPEYTVNTCAMGHVLITLYESSGEEQYKTIIQEKLEYLSYRAPRFGDGVLQHTVSANDDFPEQCWADTLFMAALFMLRAGVLLEDDSIIKDALKQWYWHIEFLQNKKTGLWYHAFSYKTKSHLSGFYWGRANCWAAYTMSQVKHILKDWYLYPECMEIENSLAGQLSSLKLYQTERGLYRTLIDDVDSYEEVSASAGIAAAMLACKNPLYKKYVNRSLQGVLENIDETGRVLSVSAGTAVMKDREGYVDIPRKWIQGWGQGMVLTFMTWYSKLQDN